MASCMLGKMITELYPQIYFLFFIMRCNFTKFSKLYLNSFVTQASLNLMIFWPQLLGTYHYRLVPPGLVGFINFIHFKIIPTDMC